MKISRNSLNLIEKISDEIDNKTFHHHYHIIYDILNLYHIDYKLNYVEIGSYAGGSASLMMHRNNTNIISIDLGNPIPKEICEQNVQRFNTYSNFYKYIKGDSHSISIFDELNSTISEIDVLFIDGDHSYGGVVNDFEMYSKLVKSGGYIIFDDYNDYQYSSEVKPAVDDIISNLKNSYNIIGTIKNTLGARPIELIDGNCFIIQKL
jgi:cephalosporin hydroxylase